MAFLSKLVVLLLLSQPFATAIPLDERSQSVCQSGIYGELVPALQPFPPAQTYCAKAFPPQCASAGKVSKRTQPPTKPAATSTTAKASTTSAVSSSTPKASTTKTAHPKVIAWAKLLAQGKSVVSTICSCIQVHQVRIDLRLQGVTDNNFVALHHLDNYSLDNFINSTYGEKQFSLMFVLL